MPEVNPSQSVQPSQSAQPTGHPDAIPPSVIRSEIHGPIHSENYVGPLVSLALHALFILIAAVLVIRPPIRAGNPGEGTEAELAGFSTENIADLPEMGFESADPMIASAHALPDVSAEMLQADTSISEISLSDAGPVEQLGGAGKDVNPAEEALGGGGGGGTSFFGVSSRGRYFMYIVDISGSMGAQNRLSILKDNLQSSINALPEHTSFFIYAYNDKAIPTIGATQWKQATPENKMRVTRWIKNLSSGGGTDPTSAFDRTFQFHPLPDVIYFMTDAEDLQGMPEFVGNLNNRTRKSKIHCIAFGDSGSEESMRQIAKQSGGKYRYVPVQGG